MKRLLLSLAALGFSASAAFGQGNLSAADSTRPEPGPISPNTPSFQELDVDKNGSLRFAEVASAGQAMAGHFARLDTDRDRLLSPNEYSHIAALPGDGITPGGTMIE